MGLYDLLIGVNWHVPLFRGVGSYVFLIESTSLEQTNESGKVTLDYDKTLFQYAPCRTAEGLT